MIHSEGIPTIGLVLIVSTIVFFGIGGIFSASWPKYLLLFALVVFNFLILWFFRNPDRSLEKIDDTVILAPADGKLVAIEEVMENEYFNQKMIKLSIFMSPLNVHVNRYPVSGTVKYMKYHPGKYLVAWHPKSSEKNERTTVVLESEKGSLLLRQIAGAVARRIVYYPEQGDEVKQGEELGFIKFGSRVDVFLPLGTPIEAKIDQKITGNRTVLARW